MSQPSLFTALQSNAEGIDTEFNSARGGMPGSFWESYAAMANTQGGTIVLGVAEKASGLVCLVGHTPSARCCRAVQPCGWVLVFLRAVFGDGFLGCAEVGVKSVVSVNSYPQFRSAIAR
jgi:hypothetical protein